MAGFERPYIDGKKRRGNRCEHRRGAPLGSIAFGGEGRPCDGGRAEQAEKGRYREGSAREMAH